MIRIKIDTKMRKNPVQKTKIVTIRTRSTSPVRKIRIGRTRKRIRREIRTSIKTERRIGIKANIVRKIRTRIVTAVPRINVGIRRRTKTNIPVPKTRIGGIRKRKVIICKYL